MNIEHFKIHTASRKPKCIPLQTGELGVTFPKHIAECKKGELAMLDEGEISFVDLKNHNQVILVSVNPGQIKRWSGYQTENAQLRLSRFKTNYDGMPNLPIRIWEEKNGKYIKWSGSLTNGCKVKCCCTPTKNKGKTYFNLHRDIILIDKPRQNKRRRTEYFSDEES